MSNPTPIPPPLTEERAAAIAASNVLQSALPSATTPAALLNPSATVATTRGVSVNEVEQEVQAGENVNLDETGVQVRNLFTDFLYEYWIPDERSDNNPNDDDDPSQQSLTPNNEPPPSNRKHYPYHKQARRMANLQLSALHDDDSPEDDPNDGLFTHQSSSFSTTLFVDFHDVYNYNVDLAEAIQSDYIRFEPFLRKGLQTFLCHLVPQLTDLAEDHKNPYFLAVHNLPTTLPLRSLRTDTIGSLTSFRGTVTRTSEIRPELLLGTFRCLSCGILAERIPQQYYFTRPTICRNPRCANRSSPSTSNWLLDIPSSEFCDWQKLRLQENSADVPPGCMPRSVEVVVRNEMVERCKAGDAVCLTGSLVVVPDGSALARVGEVAKGVRRTGNGEAAGGGGGGATGLKALGVRELTYRTCFVATSVLPAESAERYRERASGEAGEKDNAVAVLFGKGGMVAGGEGEVEGEEGRTVQEVANEMSEAEREDVMVMRGTSKLYEKMVRSIAPATFGHLEVKRGILLQLLGGVHKTTPSGTRLRGDLNVCIIGDPSTAKSQFLKYVHSFLPSRSIYTSGKASSAAGLTAAVQRDSETGEFCIEAGALMLADNGICCIDEFDKMDPGDQVAIHEAMEQQTISITKAGIQATLNARASILAAANPIYGRYDRSRTLKANVALSAPILSRFDLFFVVLDECDGLADYQVAKHILDVHRCEEDEESTAPFSLERMQRYIRFARTINPRMTEESRRVLIDCYRKLRQGDTMGRSRTAYRITVRQLESMIRLSEALARLHCEDVVKPTYVEEAYRLLRKSIIHVETADVTFDEDEADDVDGEGGGAAKENGDDGEEEKSQRIGEYNPEEESGDVPKDTSDNDNDTTENEPPAKKARKEKKKKKKKAKTQITFEEYQIISTAIATYLRAKEGENTNEDENDGGGDDGKKFLTWGETLQWYLEQCEEQIGDSVEELKRLEKLTNMVIRRLIKVDHILVYLGGESVAMMNDEKDRTIAVHPNYVV